ncbi:MAG: trypsin-like peptidase domain-containing protein [Kiritimatiellae bacterium]|jgi:serine protease Do|nr:trypsin-like peptidase domain-containing protein [Kiritimatiellia bacterium]
MRTVYKSALLLAAFLISSISSVANETGIEVLDFRNVIKQSKDKVFPSVVYIKCVRDSYEKGEKAAHQVSGSGVLISADGEILTNWHVIDKATEIRCLLFNGQHFTAKLVGKDKDIDLALIKLDYEGKDGLPYSSLGNSDKLGEGDFVIAMGAPFGLTRSVSIGIISCTSRYLERLSQYSLWLQTDASINPGNSGGPLVNTDGEVVGINTLGIMYGGNMAFAVPSTTIKEILPRLREHGSIKWSWTGIEVQSINDFDRDMYFGGTNGVIVSSTEKSSPAKLVGIQNGDRIIKINDVPINGITEESLPAIRRKLGLLPVNIPAELLVLRDNKELIISLIPREKGDVEGKDFDAERWDMTVKNINQFDNPSLYFHKKTGIFIYSIKRPGNAGNAGFNRNDIISKINGKDITSIKDIKTCYQESLDNIDENPRILFVILRNGARRQLVLNISQDYNKE